MEAASIVVRRSHGVLVVQATGRTGKGQTFLKGQAPLKVKSMRDPNFKDEMAAALKILLDSGE